MMPFHMIGAVGLSIGDRVRDTSPEGTFRGWFDGNFYGIVTAIHPNGMPVFNITEPVVSVRWYNTQDGLQEAGFSNAVLMKDVQRISSSESFWTRPVVGRMPGYGVVGVGIGGAGLLALFLRWFFRSR